MCKQCHDAMNDEEILRQCQDALKTPKYTVWNATSLNHTKITAVGYNGKEAQDIAIQLLLGFIEWAKANEGYEGRVNKGVFGMPSIKELEATCALLLLRKDE